MFTLSVDRGDATLEARFEKPAFELLRPDGYKLHNYFHESFSRWGLHPMDISLDIGQSKLSEKNVTYYLPLAESSIRIWLDRFECSVSLHKIDESDAKDIFEEAIQIITSFSEAEISTYSAAVGLHGSIGEETHLSFLKAFLSKDNDINRNLHSAGILLRYYEEDESVSSILMEPSQMGMEKTFFRITTMAEKSAISYDQVYDYFKMRTDNALQRIGIEIVR